MIKIFKSADLYRRIPLDHQQSTTIGGILSILSYLVMLSLIISEFYSYTYSNSDKIPSLGVDNTETSEKISIFINISFFSLPCNSILAHYTDTNGKHYEIFTLQKSSTNKLGKLINPQDNTLTEINNKIITECGSCYGAELDENQCCNTCEDVMEAYSKKQWKVPKTDGIAQCAGVKIKEKQNGPGCMISGYLQVKRIPGDFHFKANMP